MTYYEDVMMWLANYCEKHKIEINYLSDMSPTDKPQSFRYPKIIFLNDKWFNINEKPFIFAHEIGHTLCAREDLVKKSDTYSKKSKNEYFANKFAIRLLQKYCEENDIVFNSVYDFANAFGIPSKYWYLLEKVCY